jgi:SAM-dependent MidA family methyltransferase
MINNVGVPWSVAMGDALYGADGFFRRQAPGAHFRTSAHTGPIFAGALTRVLESVDAALGRPAVLDLVDVGAGRGELLTAMIDCCDTALRDRLRITAVEIADRPAGLDPAVDWRSPPPSEITGLLIASEWLDNVPLDIAVRDSDWGYLMADRDSDWRYLMADRDGAERTGDMLDADDRAWVERWWPDGVRVEIGRTRDAAWADAVGRIRAGLALAIDYGHTRDRRPPLGTLTGFRDGRAVAPVPDGTCDLTAHIAIDAVAAAGSAVAGLPASTVRQADALHALGVSGRRPDLALAGTDPAGYVRALAAASHAAELTDSAGLGGHVWIFQPVAIRWSGGRPA